MAREVSRICSEAEYERALDEVELFFNKEPLPGTPEAERFNMLARAIEAYESEHWSIEQESARQKQTEQAMAKRTTHRSTKGTKLYAVRDNEGKFKDIQTFKRAHSQDIKRTSKAEQAKKKEK